MATNGPDATGNKAVVVLGAQWGDEGKGKLVDILTQQADLVARCQGGNNAGHTIVVDGVKFDFHMLPSGLLGAPSTVSLVGSGVVLHLPSFFEEVKKTESKGVSCANRLFVSDRCHLVFDLHQIVDGLKEGELASHKQEIGTTKKGIGPAYSSKASRGGVRVHHLIAPDFAEFESRFRQMAANKKRRYGDFPYDVDAEVERYRQYRDLIRPYVVDSVTYVHKALQEGKRVLVEGANAVMLDIDFGTFPYVTSSNTTIGGVCTGLGLPPKSIGKVIGVVKAYTTRVGAGPFPTEQLNEVGEHLQTVGAEFGVTTGRKRRCGWLDAAVLRWSHMINGYDSINLTKLDILDGLPTLRIGIAYKHRATGQVYETFPADLHLLEECDVIYEELPGWKESIGGCKSWDALPENARKYVERIEQLVGVNVEYIGVGVSRDSMITKSV
ncbi:Adenylosuccinate synthetase [Gonapodya prolifera JEL478]|uniref:Adenylosuccinate synthetase n=1 Tax=Gonapodya prolifera (strain JEL478) TaxID=1344416 RepID=A0A139AVD1_GONPJ|nr:Adenylosuccinate synthetase [Gonapodya prolifera JEL478]|eukprot:KXS20690.1 Adenylosuccinate synthetase [Gonapodya prolifera JEL478]